MFIDDYNHSGQIIAFGGPHTRVAVDGRADLYGAKYVGHYIDLLNLGPRWRRTLAELDANYALIRTHAAIRYVLAQQGWTTLGQQAGLILLVAPGTPTTQP